MIHATQFAKRLDRFRSFLEGHGAELLIPTNEWEMLRFRAEGITSIVYTTATGSLTMTGEAAKAWDAYMNSKPWRACKATAAPKNGSVKIKTLLARDGNLCFYCHKPMQPANTTIEHLVSRTHQGPNHISNMVLAHKACNNEVGNLSAMEKIAVREKNHPHNKE